MKKVAIINSSDTFEKRVDMIYNALNEMGYEVEVFTSDYMHIEKRKRVSKNPDYVFLKTIPYYKNISLKRILSHIDFAYKALRELKKKQYHLLYIVIPPNIQSLIAARFYRKNDVKIIIDVIDMWPESLPIGDTSHFPFAIWAYLRNRNLRYADFIITECEIYQEKLIHFFKNRNVKTIYWAKRANQATKHERLSKDCISLCYLGSINHIVDIELIGIIIQKLCMYMPVELKVIGKGENKETLIMTAKKSGASVSDYGIVYGEKEKQEIFDTCHFGLNIMKKDVCIGLTMKSIDYLSAGLPLINNVPGDTHELIIKENAGFNWSEDRIKEIVNMVKNETMEMRKNAEIVFQKYFTEDCFTKQIKSIFMQILK